MPAGASSDGRNAKVVLRIAGTPVEVELGVPAGPVPAARLLPAFRAVTEAVVGVAIKGAEADGETISCRAGCGACCRQLVPISELEARRLRDLAHELPEPRRSRVRRRFEDARRRLEEAGLLARLREPGPLTPEQRRALGTEYFALGIACPFLEAESCSIYEERPLACREYLVTSPAAHCARPSAETVKCVKLPGRVSEAVRRIGKTPAEAAAAWVTLSLAPEWADAHRDEPPPRPGPELLREMFDRLTGGDSASEPSATAPG